MISVINPSKKINSNNHGFTLVEILVVVFIAGIMAAIAGPGMLGMVNNGRIEESFGAVRGALQEAQRQAIKKSVSCTLDFNQAIDANGKTVSVNSPDGCLNSEPRIFADNIVLEHDIHPSDNNKMMFDYRGSIITNEDDSTLNESDAQITFVVSMPGYSPKKKCVVISTALGLIRSGNFEGEFDSSNGVDSAQDNASNCITPQI